jgi:hypothetical protein
MLQMNLSRVQKYFNFRLKSSHAFNEMPQGMFLLKSFFLSKGSLTFHCCIVKEEITQYQF